MIVCLGHLRKGSLPGSLVGTRWDLDPGIGAIPEEREENGTRVPLEGDGADGASVSSVSFFFGFLSRLRAVGHLRFASSATPWTGPVQPDSELWPRSPGWIRSRAQPVKGLAIARMFA